MMTNKATKEKLASTRALRGTSEDVGSVVGDRRGYLMRLSR